MPNIMFNGMALIFKIRDFLFPRDDVLEEVNLKPGDHVLDYGCGPGAYVPGTAKRIGAAGKLYALDIHPLALQKVQNLAQKQHLTQVHTICSNCKTEMPDNSVDVVLLYDIFHMLSEPDAILAELQRILKPDGILSVNDHHISETAIISGITENAHFTWVRKGDLTYTFKPNWPQTTDHRPLL